MVFGHHLIWTVYGWWLPNDPRGSSSHEIRVEPVAELGELHHGRQAIQPATAEIRGFQERARDVLSYPVLTFDADDVAVLAESFAKVIHECRYTCYACAIMPDHVHMLIRKHRDTAEVMLEQLQAGSALSLSEEGRRPHWHPIWGGPGWKVFVDSRGAMERTVAYIERNPDERGMPTQLWPFVSHYDGWQPGLARR